MNGTRKAHLYKGLRNLGTLACESMLVTVSLAKDDSPPTGSIAMPQRTLRMRDGEGTVFECPLTHEDVKASISLASLHASTRSPLSRTGIAVRPRRDIARHCGSNSTSRPCRHVGMPRGPAGFRWTLDALRDGLARRSTRRHRRQARWPLVESQKSRKYSTIVSMI